MSYLPKKPSLTTTVPKLRSFASTCGLLLVSLSWFWLCRTLYGSQWIDHIIWWWRGLCLESKVQEGWQPEGWEATGGVQSDKHEFWARVSHLLALRPWTNHFPSLPFSFPICKTGVTNSSWQGGGLELSGWEHWLWSWTYSALDPGSAASLFCDFSS